MRLNKLIKIGDRFKSLRLANGLTQAQLANEIGIPRTTYANYESNKREPTLSALKQIAIALNVDIDYLLDSSYNKVVDLDNIEKEEEIEIVDAFNALNYKGQIALKKYLEFLQQDPDYTTPLTREEELKLSYKEFFDSAISKTLVDSFKHSQDISNNKENSTNANEEK